MEEYNDSIQYNDMVMSDQSTDISNVPDNINILITWGMIAIGIILTAIIIVVYLRKYKSKQLLNYVPTVWTSLGILGTFVTIVLRLDGVNDLNDVDVLVRNLVPAFWTSIIGISGALISSVIIKYIYARDEKEELSELAKASGIESRHDGLSLSPELALLKIEKHLTQSNQTLKILYDEIRTIRKENSETIERNLQQLESLYDRIFEENRNPIESWMNKNIEKIRNDLDSRFILIPKIKTEREEGEYYFDDFNIDTSKFNQKPIDNKLLLQNLIDASEVKLIEGGYINFDAIKPERTILEELRNKAEIDYEKTSELLHKLINQVIDNFKNKFDNEQVKNIVMMYKRELANEIYGQMLKHFVRNEGIIKEEVFTERPINYQSKYKYDIKKNLFDNYNSDRDGRITSILFEGIKRGVFNTAKFDSVPELQFAKIVERENNFVEKWLRPSPIDFNITYNGGKSYEPDFVIETEKTIFLVEIKGDDKLNDPDVLAKKEKSIDYCKLVSKWAEDTGNKKWVYVFIPASKISSQSTFKYLSEYYSVE